MMRDFDHLTSRDVDQPPGAVFMMARAEYDAMCGLDEILSLFYNDVDLSKRLWAKGRKIRYLAEVNVMHHLGASTSKNANFLVSWHRNRRSYYRKHHTWFGGPWIRMVSWLRYYEEWLKIGRRAENSEQRKAERDHLRAAAKQVWAR